MKDMKVSIGVAVAIFLQAAGFIWWTAQQAQTIAALEETVSVMSSRMAIEDQVNTKRDVARNSEEIEYIWEEIDAMNQLVQRQIDILRRLSVVETELSYINRDHDAVINSDRGH